MLLVIQAPYPQAANLNRRPANAAHVRQSRQGYGLGYQGNVLKTVESVLSSRWSGVKAESSSSSLLLSTLDLSDTQVYGLKYEPSSELTFLRRGCF